MSSPQFFPSLLKMILHSDKPIDEKEQLLLELNKNEKDLKNSLLEIQLRDEKIEHLEKEKCQETLYKLHYQQLLTVRSVIENFEKGFGDKLRKKNISRIEKWNEFLKVSDEKFKPFKEAGFDIEVVSNTIDDIYKRHSADIHSVQAVEGLILDARGLLTPEEMKIIQVIIHNSPWRNLITIDNLIF